MRNFAAMVRTARRIGIMPRDGIDADLCHRVFWRAVVKNEVFVFQATEGPMQHVPPDSGERLDGPFPVYSIEIAGGWMSSSPQAVLNVHIGCMMAVESVSPEYPEGFVYVYSSTDGIAQREAVLCYRIDDPASAMRSLIREYLDRLAAERDGLEEVEEVVQLPNPRNPRKTKPHVIRRVFHIYPKRATGEARPVGSGSGRVIQWTHSWSVRGCWVHFRLPDGSLDLGRLGKDRRGEYCVPGKTWRVAHVKGAKDAPIKKVRVVHS